MKTISLALASALTAVIGFAQPVLAQSLDQTGSSSQRSAGDSDDMDRGGAMTSGESRSRDRGSWHGRRDEDSSGPGGRTGSGGRHGGRLGEGGGMEMRRGLMERHHQMMMGAMSGGARFRFTRGDARIDVQCPAQENMRVCVAAATELLDKIVSLHGNGSHESKATGSGSTPQTSGSGLDRGRAPGADQQDEDNVPAPGHDSMPNRPGDQM